MVRVLLLFPAVCLAAGQGDEMYLPADDVCDAGDDECALSLRQLRGEKVVNIGEGLYQVGDNTYCKTKGCECNRANPASCDDPRTNACVVDSSEPNIARCREREVRLVQVAQQVEKTYCKTAGCECDPYAPYPCDHPETHVCTKNVRDMGLPARCKTRQMTPYSGMPPPHWNQVEAQVQRHGTEEETEEAQEEQEEEQEEQEEEEKVAMVEFDAANYAKLVANLTGNACRGGQNSRWRTAFGDHVYNCAIKTGADVNNGAKCVSNTYHLTAGCSHCFGLMMHCGIQCASQCCGGTCRHSSACVKCSASKCDATFRNCAGYTPPH